MSSSNDIIAQLLDHQPGLRETVEKLLAEFASLNIADNWNKGENLERLMYWQLEDSIPHIVERLIFDRLTFRPEIEEIAKGPAREDLKKVLDAANLLLKALDSIQTRTKFKMGMEVNNIAAWKRYIGRIINTIGAVTFPKTQGRPKKVAEQNIALQLCRYWLCFTGTRPTQSNKAGSFVHFLSNIFAILGFNPDTALTHTKAAVSRIDESEDDWD